MGVNVPPRLAAAHKALDRWAWRDAYDGLSAADQQHPLDAEDLDALAMAAYLTGARDDSILGWERAHAAHLAAQDVPAAVRSAFWLGLTLMLRGEHARGGGWLGRAGHELEESGVDCAEQGLLLASGGLQALGGGDTQGACETFTQVTRLADRFGDADLRALGLLGQGQALAAGGEADRGVRLLDEAMVGVTAEEVHPILAGIVYCAVIITCREALDVPRAQEWTAALSNWCDRQPDLQPFRGQCLVHRSELMQLRGEWTEAVAEAQQACDQLADPPGDPVLGMASYQQAELLRLRGSFALAEESYLRADACGHTAQPGLALLRLAQGRPQDARAAILRAVAEARGARDRLHDLAACVEIMVSAGDLDAARAAAADLAGLRTGLDSAYLRARIADARGALLVAEGKAAEAAAVLRAARTDWQALRAPYETARTRLRLAGAYLALGDQDAADMELAAAREVFVRLHAAPALAEAERLLAPPPRAGAPDGLTAREVEVLGLVATGASNQEVGELLVISDRTVARHLSNIFGKLGLSSRAAATAYAYQHGLARDPHTPN